MCWIKSFIRKKNILWERRCCSNVNILAFTVWGKSTYVTSAIKNVIVVQSLSPVQLFATLWTASLQASLSFTVSQSLLKLTTSIESTMPSKHLILCCPLLFLPSIFPSIRIFSNESALHIRWPKYWRFSFGISPSNEYSELISFRIDWFDFLAVQETLTWFFFLFLCIYMRWWMSLNLLWQSFHDVCKPDHLYYINHYISFYSAICNYSLIKLEEKNELFRTGKNSIEMRAGSKSCQGHVMAQKSSAVSFRSAGQT